MGTTKEDIQPVFESKNGDWSDFHWLLMILESNILKNNKQIISQNPSENITL